MKKSILSLLLALLAILFISCSDGDSSGGSKNNDKGEDKQLEQLYELSQEAVKVKVNEIHKNGSGYSYADVTVTIPDYTEMFLDVAKKSDPVSAVSKALKSSDYEKLKLDVQVPVTFDERGKETVHSEDEVRKLLEKELIKALNTVYEEIEQ